MPWLDRVIQGNTLGTWLVAVGTAAATWAVLRMLQGAVAARFGRRAARTASLADELITRLAARVPGAVILAIALAAGGLLLSLPAPADRILRVVLAAAVLTQIGLWGSALLTFGAALYVRRRLEQDPAAVTTITVLSFVGRMALWSLVLLIALDNIGIDITALVAGLGIGGIAVALALQNVLGDLFAAFAIAIDRPFSIGDFIIVDDLLGTVEHVGLKTTRIRSLSGEQVAIANSNLLDGRIRNYQRMAERRVVFTFGVAYETSSDLVEAVPAMLREIVERQPAVRFNRAHFKTFGDFALVFEVVYHVLSPDYGQYMDIQQAINLAIVRRFADAGIAFAYPTQTLHVHWVSDRAAMAPAGSVRGSGR